MDSSKTPSKYLISKKFLETAPHSEGLSLPQTISFKNCKASIEFSNVILGINNISFDNSME